MIKEVLMASAFLTTMIGAQKLAQSNKPEPETEVKIEVVVEEVIEEVKVAKSEDKTEEEATLQKSELEKAKDKEIEELKDNNQKLEKSFKDLTAAIGVRGQNAKLAAQSSGWKIEIKSITQAKEEGIRYRRIDSETT